jgi:hypothetical protein
MLPAPGSEVQSVSQLVGSLTTHTGTTEDADILHVNLSWLNALSFGFLSAAISELINLAFLPRIECKCKYISYGDTVRRSQCLYPECSPL